MDWVSVQCSCQSFTFGVPFMGAQARSRLLFSCQEKKIFFFLAKGTKRPHPSHGLCEAKVEKNGLNFQICEAMQ